ncbi:hypothetical protein BAUCODRAFT_121596 [Baudoinia panamericana UAMH 10762]|uniref:Uncharacterized protein n=1 Tax=Baudoinia panamericana (strain UAMH 10762) TaxID=717646 RepID=M2ND06_BAUPA|nr:uncharacterized protein BAUCODRAFT_121596 [Baudoinia panamericana UAMH 10762]EMC97079.1 hypothetical protein BAUCODRAFT_121596 [Baudoinia panamericana UAMH 10762]
MADKWHIASVATAALYVLRPLAVLIWYIVRYIIFVVVILLQFLYQPLRFLLQPFIYFGRLILLCLLVPFQLLAKLETIYIYLGVAAIVGALVGLALSYTYGSISTALHLDAKSGPARLRTARQYREANRKRREKAEVPLIPPAPSSPVTMSSGQPSPAHLSLSDSARKTRRGKGLLNQTIIEELDSEY